MPPSAADTPTLFALHGLGLSRRLFDALARELDGAVDVIALDLPGFGDERESPETSVEQMTESVVRRIREHSARRWLIAGHSMGGRIASLVAERTMSGRSGLFGLAGVVLMAGSPLSPEPMDEERRRTMLDWVDDGPLDDDQARTFLEQNVGAPLPSALEQQALADLRRTSPDAWREWLETGSRTDFSGDVSALPALLIAGGEDGDLGEDAQRRTNGRLYPRSRLVTFEGPAT
ncbi:alpha/beta hydrolase [Rathayibacter oskolensis]|uniref:alpha/beta fold hydrolase n=1 Tax=Rathayibacter oskolensis TaxID=1891671 RepID=UPI00265FDFD0|nr:alpha/beta hydrolase [Rathayibacter oskolensis]WKK72321.1 alpha/beta hydrolase [Rathayibacter oskolensis]